MSTTPRITEIQVDQQLIRATQLLRAKGAGLPLLYKGNSQQNIPNRLMIDGTNVWPDGMAGFTRKDCFNALRVMIATLSAID